MRIQRDAETSLATWPDAYETETQRHRERQRE